MDTQLYKEDWVPTLEQLLHVSLGIADGMTYLHTAFDKPLIHRDLKSPNVLLTASPSDRDCVAKITDFGLARDKADDDNMTGCGSVLWMAPEILLSEPYTAARPAPSRPPHHQTER